MPMIDYLLAICSGTLQETDPVVPLNFHTVLTIVANSTGIRMVVSTIASVHPNSTVSAVEYGQLITSARYTAQPNGSSGSAKGRVAWSRECILIAQLMTNHCSIREIPTIMAHSPPCSIAPHFNSS